MPPRPACAALPPPDGACCAARAPLVIAGGGWGRVLDDPAIVRAQAGGALRLAGHVPQADLACLTARAACVACASLDEGFGRPVIEAMAAGAPVVASCTTGTGETAGGALPVDPLDTDAIAAAIRRVVEDPAFAAGLRARGLLRASRFTSRASTASLVMSWSHAPAGAAWRFRHCGPSLRPGMSARRRKDEA